MSTEEVKALVEELRYGAEYGCDYDLIERAAAAIEELQQKWFKSETDATNLTGKLAQAEADIERLNLEIDKRIATEIDLSNQVDALQAEVDKANKSADAYRAMYFAKRGDITIEKVRELDEVDCHFHSALIRLMYKRIEELEAQLPKRGEWINSKERMRPDMCSVCGCIYEADRFMDKIAWNYCPNCGSLMVGENDERN